MSTTSGSRNSRRSRRSCSRGVDQSVASARNDTTSTVAAAAANSDLGIGRAGRPTSPCAKTGAGGSTPQQSKNEDRPAEAGPSSPSGVVLLDYLQDAVEVPDPLGCDGGAGFGA